MGYIKEPEGVDFFVDSTPLSEKEIKELSDIITYYKLTGRKKTISSLPALKNTLTRKLKTPQLVK
jgi:hypothetical protein